MRDSHFGDKQPQRELRNRIRGYERKVRTGEDTVLLHEQMREEVAYFKGDATAEYFDRKQTLPYKQVNWLPLPVDEEDLEVAYLVRAMVSILAGSVLAFLLRDLGLSVMLCAGAIGCVVLYFFIFPLLAHMPVLPSMNLSQREADVRLFEEIKVAHEEAHAAEVRVQKEEAKEIRAARLAKPIESFLHERE